MYTHHNVLVDRLVAVTREADGRLRVPKRVAFDPPAFEEPTRSSMLFFNKEERAILARDFAAICRELRILVRDARTAGYAVIEYADVIRLVRVEQVATNAANEGDDTYAWTMRPFVSCWYRYVVRAFLRHNMEYLLTELQLNHATSFFEMDGAELVGF